jgi:hypothetical protein
MIDLKRVGVFLNFVSCSIHVSYESKKRMFKSDEYQGKTNIIYIVHFDSFIHFSNVIPSSSSSSAISLFSFLLSVQYTPQSFHPRNLSNPPY